MEEMTLELGSMGGNGMTNHALHFKMNGALWLSVTWQEKYDTDHTYARENKFTRLHRDSTLVTDDSCHVVPQAVLFKFTKVLP